MIRMLSYLSATALFALGFFATGSLAEAQGAGFPPGVTGVTWQLRAMQGPAQDLQDLRSANVTLKFDGQGLATGNSPCNSYSAPYQEGTGQALTFGNVLSTLRACVDPSLNQLETDYYNALKGVTSYSFDGATLRLFYDNGASILTFSAAGAPPGMPATGAGTANQAAFLIAGALLVALGAACLVAPRVRRNTAKQS